MQPEIYVISPLAKNALKQRQEDERLTELEENFIFEAKEVISAEDTDMGRSPSETSQSSSST